MFAGYRQRGRLERVIRQWTEYRSLVLTKLGGEHPSPGDERHFLDLKGKLSEVLATLADSLGPQLGQEMLPHVEAMSGLLNKYPTLYAEQPLTGPAREEFEREWHAYFLFLNRLKGLEPAPPQGDPRAGAAYAEASKRKGGGAVHILFRLLIVVGVLILIVKLTPWGKLVAAAPPESQAGLRKAGEFLTGAWDATTATVRGSGLLNIADPVVDRYGPEATMVMFALLLIAVGYWVFLRLK